MTTEQIIARTKASPALKHQSDTKDEFSYPERYKGKVPLKVKLTRTVWPDMPFLCKQDTVCRHGHEYYVWINSHGAVAAILDNGEELGLKPDEFEVTEWHESNQ